MIYDDCYDNDDDNNDTDDDDNNDGHRVALHELPGNPLTVSQSAWRLLSISIFRWSNKILLMMIMIRIKFIIKSVKISKRILMIHSDLKIKLKKASSLDLHTLEK